MPEGYIRLLGDTRRALARRVAELREARVYSMGVGTGSEMSEPVHPPVWQPGMPFPDATPRPARQEVFNAGDEPLPGGQWHRR
jgi:hypothetical protein